jgi:hypothetical protein
MSFVKLNIVDLATENDIEAIEGILRFGPECVDEVDADGMTALHWACVCGYEELAALLLDKGASANTRSGADSTPMHDAARGGNAAMLGLLAARGGDLTAADRDGNTPLHEAARGGHVAAAEVCLGTAGVNIDAQTGAGNTAMHYASMWGALEVLALLIDRGACTSITNNLDKSVLAVALAINDAATAKVVAVYKERMDARGVREAEEKEALNAVRIAEARAERDAKLKALQQHKSSKSGQGVYAMILSKKKSQAQLQKKAVLEKLDVIEYTHQMLSDPSEPEEEVVIPTRLPPIVVAPVQKSISSRK